MIKYGQNCLKLLVRCVFLFILFFMVEVPEKLASNTEVVLAKRRKIDRYIHYSMFQSNIISAWITYAWENQVTECESLHYHYYYYYYIKTSRQRFATHIFLCVCRLLPKNDVAASTFFCWIIIQNESEYSPKAR